MSDREAGADRPLVPGVRAPLSPAQLWRMLVARRLLIAAVIVLFVLVAVAAAVFVPDRYAASATLVIDLPGKTASGASGLSAAQAENYLATQIDLLQSDRVLRRVVTQLHLTDNPKARAAFKAAALADAAFGHWLAARLGHRLSVHAGHASRLIRVRFTDESPVRAARIANAVVRAYRSESAAIASKSAKSRFKSYSAYLDKLRTQVDTAQQKLTAARQKTGIIDTSGADSADTRRLADLGVKLNQATAARQAAQAKVDRIRRLKRRGRPVSAQAEILDSNHVQRLKSRLTALESQRAKLGKTLGDNHPKIQAVDAQIATVRAKLEHEIDAYITANRGEAQTATQRESKLRDSLAHERKNVLADQKKRDDLAALARKLASAKQVYQAALGDYDQVLGADQMPHYNVSVVSPASPPDAPEGLAGKIKVVLGLLFGTLAGGALALLVELVDRRVRHGDDITRELDMPVLGELAR